MYEHFASALGGCGVRVERGVCGAHMHVSLINEGPVTIMIDSRADYVR